MFPLSNQFPMSSYCKPLKPSKPCKPNQELRFLGSPSSKFKLPEIPGELLTAIHSYNAHAVDSEQVPKIPEKIMSAVHLYEASVSASDSYDEFTKPARSSAMASANSLSSASHGLQSAIQGLHVIKDNGLDLAEILPMAGVAIHGLKAASHAIKAVQNSDAEERSEAMWSLGAAVASGVAGPVGVALVSNLKKGYDLAQKSLES